MDIKFYTKKEAAEIFGIHPKTVERYLLSGKLKGARMGKSWMISSEDIKLFYDTIREETEKIIKDRKGN